MQKLIQLIVLMAVSTIAVAAVRAGSAQANSPSQSSPNSAQSSQSSTSQSSDNQSMEGCLVREEHTIYLMPATGDKVQVSSSGNQDLNSHMGEEVRLSGSGNQGNSQSASSTSGSSTSGGNEPQFVVTRVDAVSHTCPKDIQDRIDQDKARNNGSK
ncbi:MAG TPA: hypothetical protein VGJ33_18085 [Candidatus Angelobacter sp.]|jgi:hypothetical protein